MHNFVEFSTKLCQIVLQFSNQNSKLASRVIAVNWHQETSCQGQNITKVKTLEKFLSSSRFREQKQIGIQKNEDAVKYVQINYRCTRNRYIIKRETLH